MTELESVFDGLDGTAHEIHRMRHGTCHLLVDEWEGHGTRVLMQFTQNGPESEGQLTACIEDYRTEASLAAAPLSCRISQFDPPPAARPRMKPQATIARDQRILDAWREEEPADEIAEREGVSQATVQRVLTVARKLDPTIPRRLAGHKKRRQAFA